MLIVAALVFNSSVQFLLSAMSSLYPVADFSWLSIFNIQLIVHLMTACLTVKIQAWQEEVERSRQGQRDAESKLSYFEASFIWLLLSLSNKKLLSRLYADLWRFWWMRSYYHYTIYYVENLQGNLSSFAMSYLFVGLQTEVQKMRVEMAIMKRDAEHYSRQVSYATQSQVLWSGNVSVSEENFTAHMVSSFSLYPYMTND